jgi:hypothetical protein
MLCLGLLVSAFLGIKPLRASPIIYTESGLLSGTLGSTALNDVPFTFIFDGDTANIFDTGAGTLFNPALSTSITIGSSTGVFDTAVAMGDGLPFGIIGFGVVGQEIGITFQSEGDLGYALDTPISLSAPTAYFAGGTLATSLGTLDITGAQDLALVAATTPECETLALTGCGLLGLVALSKFRSACLRGN